MADIEKPESQAAESQEVKTPEAKTAEVRASESPATDSQPVNPTAEALNAEKKEPERFALFSVISLLTMLGAWVAATASGPLAIGVCVVSIVFGGLSLKSKRHIVRNTSITSIIAASVLLIVVCAFMYSLHLLLK